MSKTLEAQEKVAQWAAEHGLHQHGTMNPIWYAEAEEDGITRLRIKLDTASVRLQKRIAFTPEEPAQKGSPRWEDVDSKAYRNLSFAAKMLGLGKKPVAPASVAQKKTTKKKGA